MGKLKAGDLVNRRSIDTIQSTQIEVPHETQLTHIQFRRFVGCPICHLHLRSFVARHEELVAAQVQEVAVFHSSKESMLGYKAEAPFPLVGDPTRALYVAFGVDTSPVSILHPGAWLAALKGIVTIGPSLPPKGESYFGLPADFLIGPDGQVVASKYGVHAYDQWSVDEVLDLAVKSRQAASGVGARASTPESPTHSP
jgi:peroxiredoxin